MALITAAEARVLIPALSGTGADTDLDTLIARADAVMAAWCGMPVYDSATAPTFEDQTYTEYHDGPDYGQPRALCLRARPVQSVTTIHDDPDWAYGAADLVDSGDYTLDGERGIVWLNPDASHAWSMDVPRAIKVVYVAGYATVPVDLKQACALLVAHWWRLRHVQGRSSISGQNTSAATRDETIPHSVRQLLARFMLPAAVL